MKRKTIYRKKSRIGDKKIREIVRYFAMDILAVKASELTHLNIKTTQDWYRYIRKALASFQASKRQELFFGEVEADESYFGPSRVKGKRGRGAGMKTIVFGLLKRGGEVYTEIIPDVKARTLRSIIRKKVSEASEMNTDGWRGYDGLVDMGYEQHYRVHHGVNEFARGNQHINGIESFWSYTKRRLAKFNGIRKDFFYFFLKESEFRYNCRVLGKDVYKETLKILRKYNP